MTNQGFGPLRGIPHSYAPEIARGPVYGGPVSCTETEHPTREGKLYCCVVGTPSPVGSLAGRLINDPPRRW